MSKVTSVDVLEAVFDMSSIVVKEELLEGYKEALHEDELGVQYEGSLSDRAKEAMLDNASDSLEVCAVHFGWLVKKLIEETNG